MYGPPQAAIINTNIPTIIFVGTSHIDRQEFCVTTETTLVTIPTSGNKMTSKGMPPLSSNFFSQNT